VREAPLRVLTNGAVKVSDAVQQKVTPCYLFILMTTFIAPFAPSFNCSTFNLLLVGRDSLDPRPHMLMILLTHPRQLRQLQWRLERSPLKVLSLWHPASSMHIPFPTNNSLKSIQTLLVDRLAWLRRTSTSVIRILLTSLFANRGRRAQAATTVCRDSLAAPDPATTVEKLWRDDHAASTANRRVNMVLTPAVMVHQRFNTK
jgi:hypothetical protein